MEKLPTEKLIIKTKGKAKRSIIFNAIFLENETNEHKKEINESILKHIINSY